MNKAVGTHLIIKIDGALQKAKNILTPSGLIVPPQFEYMMYNLQYGEILSVGEKVTHPSIQPGRLAIIHHLIESEDKYLIETLDNGDQIRWVDTYSTTFSYKFYGVMDEDGLIMPMEQFVFCDPEPAEEDLRQYEIMKFGDTDLRFSTEKVGELYLAHVPVKEREKLYIRPTVRFVSDSEHQIRVGDQVLAQDFTRYPITLLDREYWILSREFIISIQGQ